VCARYNNPELPLKRLNLRDAKRVYVVIDYKITIKFGLSGGLSLLSNFEDNVKRLVSDKETNRTKTTVRYDPSEDNGILKLTLYASKACVQVFKITVYYHVCPANETLLVTRTVAPSSGFIEASANCSIKQSGKKGSVVVAKCGSDGEWRKVEDEEGGCSSDCGAGTELINDTCTGTVYRLPYVELFYPEKIVPS
jgi:hypothetical protein